MTTLHARYAARQELRARIAALETIALADDADRADVDAANVQIRQLMPDLLTADRAIMSTPASSRRELAAQAAIMADRSDEHGADEPGLLLAFVRSVASFADRAP